MYLDASNYMIEYSGILAQDFNLVSNFQMFDQKYKGNKWFNNFTGVSSLGMNPFLVDEMAKNWS